MTGGVDFGVSTRVRGTDSIASVTGHEIASDEVGDGHSKEWVVCVYCASIPTDPDLIVLAGAVGAAIARRGWTLLWGGCNVSAMGALAKTARDHGGRTIGVIPRIQYDIVDPDADELIVTDTVQQRKLLMAMRSNAFLALSGGLGTLEELFEIWGGRYTGEHDKSVALLDPNGHYDGLLTWMNGLVRSGYVEQIAMDRLMVFADVDEALAACAPRDVDNARASAGS